MPTNYLNESANEHDSRMSWWKQAHFGMFIHLGLYSIPAGIWNNKSFPGGGEWIMAEAEIPLQEYELLAKKFNPTKFDAVAYVTIAKSAGMKYIVFTTKHHDGFAMWNSKTSNYNIMNTPFGKDAVKELKDECERQKIKFGVYYSILDWYHGKQELDNNLKNKYNGIKNSHIFTKTTPEGKNEYVRYMKSQLKELIENYNPSIIWFDGEWVKWWTEEDGKDLYNYLRSIKRDLIINNRIGKGRNGMHGLNKGPGYAGDFGTPESRIPDTTPIDKYWETCMTMNNTWGFKTLNKNWKSAEELIRQLNDTGSKGGNYLLNVGPNSEGLIPNESIECLKEIGKRIKTSDLF